MTYIYGRGPVIEALKNKKVDKLYLAASGGSIIKIKAMADENKVLIARVSKDKLDKMTEGKNHQGVCALVSGFKYTDFDELLNDLREKEAAKLLILDKIEDPHNFGAIIRSSLYFAFDAIIIPRHGSVLVNDTVYKTSQGAVDSVKISVVNNLSQAIEKLKKESFWIYACHMNGENIKDTTFDRKLALIIGNEAKGIAENLKKHADFIVKVPNYSDFDSLNASVAAAIVMYEVVR